MKNKPTPDELLTAIRIKCLECSGGSRKMVERCEVKNCPLYPWRSKGAMGIAGDGKTHIKGQMSLNDILKAGNAG